MQFLPAVIAGQAKKAVAGAMHNAKNGKGKAQAGFGNLFSSFIEEDRLVYSGRPLGAPAQEKNSGTIGNGKLELFKDALRKRRVPEETILGLEAYVQNGSPLTVARAFSILSGERGRYTENLDDKERDAFKMLLGKMGFSKDQVEDMVALNDDGKGKILLQQLRETFKQLEGKVDVSKAEFSSLLRGLDLPQKSMAKIMQLLEKRKDLSLSGEELEVLLADAGKEFALRDQNALVAKAQMRSAMKEALGAAKVHEQAAPVDDQRGSRRSEQLENLMHDSVLKRTGADRVKKEFGAEDEGFDRNSKENVWRSPQTEAQLRAKGKTGDRKKPLESASAKMLQSFEIGAGSVAMEARAGQARNLDIVASRYSREIFSQVENGILQSAQNGTQRISLQLMPEELGKLTIVLSMHQGELRATITAEHQESAALLGEQMAELKASLEEQGLKVSELEVQTELRDNRFSEQWSDHREHNLMNDAQERERLLRLSRLRRDQAAGDGGASASGQANQMTETGLHIVA